MLSFIEVQLQKNREFIVNNNSRDPEETSYRKCIGMALTVKNKCGHLKTSQNLLFKKPQIQYCKILLF